MDPGEALSTLEGIPTEGMDARKRARHALLTSLALDKCYIDTPDDSLVRIAARYYDAHGSVRDRMLAAYSLGRVRNNAGRDVEAILAFQRAEMLSRECGDLHYLGLSFRNEGEIYGHSHNYLMQEQCYEKSLAAFRAAGDTLYVAYACLSLARTLGILGKTAGSDRLLRGILKGPDVPDLQAEVWRSLAANHAAASAPDPDSILYYYGLCLGRGGSALTAAEETERALAYALRDRRDSAEAILARAQRLSSPEERIVVDYNRARIHSLDGMDTEGEFLKMNRAWNDLFYRDICASVSAFTGEYYRMEAMQQRYRSSVGRLRTAFAVFLLVLTVVSGCLWTRYRRKIWDATLTTASLLFRQQDQVLAALIPERIQLLNRLAEMYADLDESDSGLLSRKDKDRNQVILSFKEELNRLRKDSTLWAHLEGVLDREKGNIAGLLKTCFPGMREQDNHLLMLLYAGVKAESAGIICGGIMAGTVRQKKLRFLERVRGASLPDRDRKALLDNMP